MSKEVVLPGLIQKALSSLGKGFDITSDFRLKFCKGEERLILLNETETKELEVPGFGSIENVSIDIKCDKGDRTRYQSDVLEFNQMSELFNRKCHISGKVPSGQFNSMFGFSSSSWSEDASNTKCLALDGYFIILFNLHIERSSILLIDEVHNAVPSTWNPVALARFIEKYGTHIIVGLSIGGKDVVLVRQDKSSNLQSSQLKEHLDTLGDQLFTGSCALNKDNRQKVPQAFNVFDPQPVLFNSFSSVTGKDGITVVCCKSGGDAATVTNHSEWLPTVASTPDAIHFSFMPITSLLKPSLPGKGLLSHAINLYLRYKPPIADLKYFLDFQSHTLWAPIHNDLPLGSTTNMAVPTPTALYFNFMGPKIYVNTAQVTVGRTPVTGMRLYLEGMKCNRLAVHLQHLSNIPKVLENKIDDMSVWRGSDEVTDERYLEAIQSKRYSHVSTVLIEYEPDWTNGKHISFIVTGVQLHVKKHESKSVLHLRLLFSKVSNSFIRKSVITQGSSDFHNRSSTMSMPLFSGNLDKEKQPMVVLDSAVFPTGPPMSAYTQKHLRFVDTSEIYKGPRDSPGYWIVTGAKLDVEKGKICLHVKFSLLMFMKIQKHTAEIQGLQCSHGLSFLQTSLDSSASLVVYIFFYNH